MATTLELQEPMSNIKPFLGKTDKVNEAFPGVISLNVKITQDPFGHYTNRPGQNVSHFTLENLEKHVRCLNPHCQQGGLDLQNIVAFSESGEQTFSCNGHEGTPKGHKVGDACDNTF